MTQRGSAEPWPRASWPPERAICWPPPDADMPEGIVHLVGAGPGDPGLLTARALDLLGRADIVLYDRLVPAEALSAVREGAELRYVGKDPAGCSTPQADIDAQLVELGRAGLRVVRLKGGDPFVFGRGGEEALALARAGVRFEVVPGVTAGVAAPAYAGVPVTQRGVSSAVAFVTGHEDPDKQASAVDWAALARFPGTLVFYMGVGALSSTAEKLIAEGRSAGESAAVIANGTLASQRTVTAPLSQIAARVEEAGLRPPAITLVGPVADLRGELGWVELRPLHGVSVAVTRARAQASGLASTLRELGAEVLEAPAIRAEPRAIEGEAARSLARLAAGGYSLLCVTSANGAALLMRALYDAGHDARSIAATSVAAVGPATVDELGRHGIRPDIVPQRSTSEGLVEALGTPPGPAALIVRPGESRHVVRDGLRAHGVQVDEAVLYDTVAEPLGTTAATAVRDADYLTFSSGSTVRHLVAALEGAPLSDSTRVVSIGPSTSTVARELGITVHLEATCHDVGGLVEVLLEDARGRPASA